MDWISILFVLALIVFFVYYIYNDIDRGKVLNELVIDWYKKNLTINNISQLNLSEKIKYGVPISPYISFLTKNNVYFNSSNSYSRKIETSNNSENEQIRYVEINFNFSNLEVHEFEVYKF